MKASGILDWSIRFCPLWQMPLDPPRVDDKCEPPDTWSTWFEKPDWERERAKRRKETLAWFTGQKERDELEAAQPPGDLKSGVLQVRSLDDHTDI